MDEIPHQVRDGYYFYSKTILLYHSTLYPHCSMLYIQYFFGKKKTAGVMLLLWVEQTSTPRGASSAQCAWTLALVHLNGDDHVVELLGEAVALLRVAKDAGVCADWIGRLQHLAEATDSQSLLELQLVFRDRAAGHLVSVRKPKERLVRGHDAGLVDHDLARELERGPGRGRVRIGREALSEGAPLGLDGHRRGVAGRVAVFAAADVGEGADKEQRQDRDELQSGIALGHTSSWMLESPFGALVLSLITTLGFFAHLYRN